MAQIHPSPQAVNKILKAVQNGTQIYIEEVFKKYPDLHWSSIQYDKTGDTILHCAARLGRSNIIKYLLENFQPRAVDCRNKDDKTALHEAAQFSQFEACRILLKYGAAINALKRADWTPLMLACTKINGHENYKILDTFLKNGAFVNYTNKDGWTCLHLICREGDAAILNLLIQSGLNLKARTKNGRTGLHVAALHGHAKIVEILLDCKVDVNEIDNSGNTPLHEAVLGGHVDICKTIIKKGADTTLRNNSNYNLLHLASSQGHIDIIKFLLNDLKQDINEANESGLIPLHCAARNNRVDTYHFLVKNGGNENTLDNFQRKPTDYLFPNN